MVGSCLIYEADSSAFGGLVRSPPFQCRLMPLICVCKSLAGRDPSFITLSVGSLPLGVLVSAYGDPRRAGVGPIGVCVYVAGTVPLCLRDLHVWVVLLEPPWCQFWLHILLF